MNLAISVISFLWPFILLGLGWGIGRSIISRHQNRLEVQEDAFKDIRLHNIKYIPPMDKAARPAETHLVTGSLVLSIDVFRRLIASFMQMLGGEVNNYSELLERGRRDALLQLKAHAHRLGAQDVYNIKIQSASIGASRGIEILAYGTAVKPL